MAIHIALVCSLLLSIPRTPVAETKIAFGAANPPSIHVAIVRNERSLSTKKFFTTFVSEQIPVLFKAAILNSPAYRLWTDEYFMKLSGIPDNHTVLAESKKKENRTYPTVRMPFKKFVSVYNTTDQYMVESVPPFLRLVFV